MGLGLQLVLVSVVVLLAVGAEAVQYLWYPVPVQITPTTYLRRSPGQSVHFQVRNTQDGSYHFGYDADTPRDKSYREERRDAYGRVTGSYGYVDLDGTLRIVDYVADEGGFRTTTRNQKPIFTEPTEPLQVIGPIPRPFSEFFRL